MRSANKTNGGKTVGKKFRMGESRGRLRRSCIRVSKTSVSAVERERVVSSTARCGQRTKPTAERPSVKKFRMGGRAVDCDGLENRCGGNSTGGSNPSPSARK